LYALPCRRHQCGTPKQPERCAHCRARNASGSKDEIKPDAAFRAQAAAEQPDGTYTASAIAVGRDGASPF